MNEELPPYTNRRVHGVASISDAWRDWIHQGIYLTTGWEVYVEGLKKGASPKGWSRAHGLTKSERVFVKYFGDSRIALVASIKIDSIEMRGLGQQVRRVREEGEGEDE